VPDELECKGWEIVLFDDITRDVIIIKVESHERIRLPLQTHHDRRLQYFPPHSDVGKSCLLLRFIEGRFKNQHEPTLGVEFGSKVVAIGERKIKLQLWDTAGQESFKSITRAYYKGSIGALLVFDFSSMVSFRNVRQWLHELRTHSHQKLRICLVGNKTDLEQDREVSDEDVKEFLKEAGITRYYQTSALKGLNVEAPFIDLGNDILNAITRKDIDPEIETSIGIKPNIKKRPRPYPSHVPVSLEPSKTPEKESCSC
jgi:small GTP-binding protein